MTDLQKLAQIVEGKLSKSTSNSALAKQIASYLIETRQTQHLASLMREVMAIRAEAGVIEINAVSAFNLEQKVKNELNLLIKREYPKAKKVMLDQKIDVDLVGGVRLDMPSEQLNLTIHDRMSRFKQVAIKGSATNG